jgi:hypothetical protein
MTYFPTKTSGQLKASGQWSARPSLTPRNRHDRHAGDFPYSSLEVSVIGCDDVNFVPMHSIHDAVVGVHAVVITLKPIPALISGNAEGNPVLWTKLRQLCHYARGYGGSAGGVQARHHAVEHVELALDRVAQKVGIDKYGVWRAKSGIVLEEETAGDLGAISNKCQRLHRNPQRGGMLSHFSNNLVAFLFLSGCTLSLQVLLQSGVTGRDQPLDLRKLASLLCSAHSGDRK